MLIFNHITTHYISPISKVPTPLYHITPGFSETYFNHIFNVLSTLPNLKYKDVEQYPLSGIIKYRSSFLPIPLTLDPLG